KKRVQASNAAIPIDSSSATGTSVFARAGSPVIAVNDGKVLKMGHTAQMGHYVVLQDATGNVYTYSHLGAVTKEYPVPKPVTLTAPDSAKQRPGASGSQPTPPAPAGSQEPHVTTHAATSKPSQAAESSGDQGSPPVKPDGERTSSGAPAMVKERLFADPARK